MYLSLQITTDQVPSGIRSVQEEQEDDGSCVVPGLPGAPEGTV